MNNNSAYPIPILSNLSINSPDLQKYFQQVNLPSFLVFPFDLSTKKHSTASVAPERKYRSRVKRLTNETICDVFKDKDAYKMQIANLLIRSFITPSANPHKYEWCDYGHGSNIKIAALIKNLNNEKAFVKQYSDEDLRILIMNTFQIQSYSRETLAGKAYRDHLYLFEF